MNRVISFFSAYRKGCYRKKEFGERTGGADRPAEKRKKISYRIGNHSEKTNERFHSMFDSHQAVMLIIDPKTGLIEDANQAAVHFYGYSKEQLLSLKIHEINTLTPKEVEIEREKALSEERKYFIFSHKLANGQVKWVEVYSSPFDVGGKPMLFSIIHDITERKGFEAELNESRNDLNRAQSVAHIGSWRLNLIENKLTWSDEAYRIFNITIREPLNYEMFLSFIHPYDRDMVDRKWNAALKGEEYNVDHRIVVDDKIKWVNETAILEFDEKGILVGGFGTVQDITRQKEAAQELKMSQQKLTWALQAGKGGVWDWEHATNRVWLSEELYRLYGIETGIPVDYNTMLNILDDRDKERVLKVLGDSIAKRTDIHCDMRIHHLKKENAGLIFTERQFMTILGLLPVQLVLHSMLPNANGTRKCSGDMPKA
ncbi:MAG: PAS domain S-box protein [Bacteroidales bacterium]|nr:PAS domain S-box protein [Bacteroidales bacterium]